MIFINNLQFVLWSIEHCDCDVVLQHLPEMKSAFTACEDINRIIFYNKVYKAYFLKKYIVH